MWRELFGLFFCIGCDGRVEVFEGRIVFGFFCFLFVGKVFLVFIGWDWRSVGFRKIWVLVFVYCEYVDGLG